MDTLSLLPSPRIRINAALYFKFYVQVVGLKVEMDASNQDHVIIMHNYQNKSTWQGYNQISLTRLLHLLIILLRRSQ